MPRIFCGRRSPTARMSPWWTSRCHRADGDDGLRAALDFAAGVLEAGILVLSASYEERYALELIGERAEGVGYLLKERVGDVNAFIRRSSVWRPAGARWTPRWSGECSGAGRRPPGRSQPSRARRARRDGGGKVQPWHRGRAGGHRGRRREARDKHLQKLEFGRAPTDHRRVLAVLTYLRTPASWGVSGMPAARACRLPADSRRSEAIEHGEAVRKPDGGRCRWAARRRRRCRSHGGEGTHVLDLPRPRPALRRSVWRHS